MRSDHLGTIVPISLVSVVFFRIVRSGQDNAALASQLADGVRHFGGRAEVFKQIDLDTVCRENVSRDFRELAAVVTAVMPDDNFDLVQIGKFLFHIVG